MSELAKKRCIPCEEGGPPMTPAQAEGLMHELSGDWMLVDNAHLLVREFKFKDFAQAVAFANKVATVAEEENHHPDLSITWGSVSIELSTHAVGGLSENDFILAAKIDAIQ